MKTVGNIFEKLKYICNDTNVFELKSNKLLMSALIMYQFHYTSPNILPFPKNHIKCHVTSCKTRCSKRNSPLERILVRNILTGQNYAYPVQSRSPQIAQYVQYDVWNSSSYLSSRVVMEKLSIGTRSRELAVVLHYVRGPGSSCFISAAAKVWNATLRALQLCNYVLVRGVAEWKLPTKCVWLDETQHNVNCQKSSCKI